MGTDIRGIDTSKTQAAAHLKVVASADSVTAARPMGSTTASTGASYGAAVETSSRYDTGVRAVAARYDNFEDALLPMVLASGVTGDAAVKVAEAIQANPALRAQAERAYQRAHMNAV